MRRLPLMRPNAYSMLVFLPLALACAKTPLHSDSWLGSDDLLARIALTKSATKQVLADLAHEPSEFTRVCPLPPQEHELYSYLSQLTPQQKDTLTQRLASSSFREQLSQALDRIDPSLEAPEGTWNDSKEALTPEDFSEAGAVTVLFNLQKLKVYRLASLVRVVGHEATHLLNKAIHDGDAYETFEEFQTYANSLASCIGARMSSALRVDASYRAMIDGLALPLVIQLQNENEIAGFLGVEPGKDEGVKHFAGRVDGNKISFESVVNGGRQMFEGSLEHVGTSIQLSGETWPKTDPGKRSPWRAAEMATYFADYELADFTNLWRVVTADLPTVKFNQLKGLTNAKGTYAFSPGNSKVSDVAVGANYSLALDSQIGVLIGETTSSNCVAIAMIRRTSWLAFSAWECGKSAPAVTKTIPFSSSEEFIKGEFFVEKCGSEFVVLQDGSERLRASTSLFTSTDLQLGKKNGITIGGPKTSAGNFVVRQRSSCP